MQQEIRPLVAVDIIEQLHRQFAILSGKGKIHLHFWILLEGLAGRAQPLELNIILKSQSSLKPHPGLNELRALQLEEGGIS